MLPAIGADGMVAATTKYIVDVHTSDIKNAGTDANVFLVLYGQSEDTGRIPLKKSKTFKDPFERAHIDTFEFDVSLSGFTVFDTGLCRRLTSELSRRC